MLHPRTLSKGWTELRALLHYLIFFTVVLYQWNSPPPTDNVVKAEFLTMLVVGLLISAVTLVLSELLRPKPDIEDAKPAGKGAFQFPTAIEDRPIPIIWGRVRISGPNVVWWGDFRQVPIREKIKTGLWSKKKVTTGFRYFVGIDMAICRGGQTAVTLHDVYVGDKVLPGAAAGVIDQPNFFGGDEFGSGGIVSNGEFFGGTETQLASTYLSQFQTPISGQRGTAHYVFEGGMIANSTQIKPWAFEVSRFPTRLLDDATSQSVAGNYVSGDEIINTDDVNPMELIYESIVDDDWGMGKSNSKVDLANFAEAANTLKAEGNGFAFSLETPQKLREITKLVMEQIDGVLYVDRLTGLFKVKLARLDYNLNIDVTSITGTDTYNVPSNGDSLSVGQTFWAEGFDNPANNGRKVVVSSTATTVVVASGSLVNETPSGSVFGGPRISELNGIHANNKVEVREFSRQTWDGTTNQIRVGFTDRSRDYFNTFARADNLANQRMQNGEVVIGNKNYPGVKNAALANAIAARELRFLSFPLSKATVITNRDLWDAQPGEVVRFTNEKLGFIDLAMRITRVDFGEVGGNITVGLVQDIFSLEQGFFGDPPNTLWTLPTQGVLPIPTAEHTVFEAPRAIIDRDVDFPGVTDRVFVGARAQSGEVAIKIYQRNGLVNPPTGSYELDGRNEGLFLIGSLNVALEAGDANPTTTVQISGSPDTKARIQLAFDPDGATASEIGQQLANVIMIGNEFMAFRATSDPGGNLINLTTVYRGLMDSVPAAHDAGASVFLLFVSGGLNDTLIDPGNFISVQPRTVSRDAELSEGNSKTFTFQMDNRYRRPYPPYRLDVNGSRFATTTNLDTSITNPDGDDEGAEIEWYRKDWDTIDEVVSLSDDAGNLDASFQAKHDHEGRLAAFAIDDDSLRINLLTRSFANGRNGFISRADALWALDGALPGADQIEASVLVRHTESATIREALQELVHPFAGTSSALGSLVNLGTVFANGPISRTYTVGAAVTHDLTVSTSITGIEYRINNGSWTALASLSGETFAVNDELEFRHGDTSDAPRATIGVLDENGTDRAYVVFNTDPTFEGLAGYWNMNEASAGSSPVARASRFGGAADFTDNNTCPSGIGQFDNAVQVTDGTSDATVEHLTISNADALRKFLMPVGTEEFTIAGWFRLPTGGATAKTTQVLWAMADFDSGSPFNNRSCYVTYVDPPGGGFEFTFIENDGTVHSFILTFGGTNNVNDEDVWIHVSFVVSSAAGGTLTGYIKDGTSTQTNNTTGTGTIQTTDQPLSIGGAYHSGATETADSVEEALVDDFRIYKGRALSESEINTIVAATQPLS